MGIYISGINLPKGKHSIVEITITEDGTVFTGSADTFHKSDLRAYEVKDADVANVNKTVIKATQEDRFKETDLNAAKKSLCKSKEKDK